MACSLNHSFGVIGEHEVYRPDESKGRGKKERERERGRWWGESEMSTFTITHMTPVTFLGTTGCRVL